MNKNKFLRITSAIRNLKDNVDVWFVSAGAYAKPFSNQIKKNNGIAVDIGSAMDTWIGEYHSRKYLREITRNESK